MKRAAIETALRKRDPHARVKVERVDGRVLACVDGPDDALVWASAMATTADEALARLARGFGLRVNDDGAVTDPADAVELLTREVADWRGVDAAQGDQIARLRAEVAGYMDREAELRAANERLQRACNEGLPRELIYCPACGRLHVEGPRHDDPSVDGRTRPHHTHRCYRCGHVWDAQRWSFGVNPGEETATPPSEVARLRAVIAALEGQCRELHRGMVRRKARIARQRRDAERFRVERNAERAELAEARFALLALASTGATPELSLEDSTRVCEALRAAREAT